VPASPSDEIQKSFYLRTQLIEGKLASYYAYLAEQFESEKNYQEAERYYKKLVSIFPGNSVVWRGLGAFYARDSRFKEAEGAFLRSLELNPHDYKTYISLGSTYHALGDFPRAITAYKKALEIEPSEKKIQEIILRLSTE